MFFFFFFFFKRGSPRYYTGASRTLPSTHAIGYLGKPVRVGARRALPQEDNAILKRSASMKAYHRKATERLLAMDMSQAPEGNLIPRGALQPAGNATPLR